MLLEGLKRWHRADLLPEVLEGHLGIARFDLEREVNGCHDMIQQQPTFGVRHKGPDRSVKDQHGSLQKAILDVEDAVADLVDKFENQPSQFLAVAWILLDTPLFSLFDGTILVQLKFTYK